MKVGGVELKDGKIINLVLESRPSTPTFDPADAGEFTFSSDDGVLRFNSGLGLVPLNTTVSENPNLITSLGDGWLNSDYSFNPVPFNALDGISGLSTEDNLFTVISQITELIEESSTIEINQIQPPPGTSDLTVLSNLSGDLIFLDIETIIQGSVIRLDFSNLDGFQVTDTTQGNMLVFNDDDELVSKNVSYTYTNFTASTSHAVQHNLGQRYVSVFCINPQTNKAVTPVEINFTNSNQLLIVLDSSQPLIANITNFSHDPT